MDEIYNCIVKTLQENKQLKEMNCPIIQQEPTIIKPPYMKITDLKTGKVITKALDIKMLNYEVEFIDTRKRRNK